MFEAGTLIDERYRIISLIGEGGMAYVYRAEDTRLGRQVAIKVLREEAAAREHALSDFEGEARAAAGLSHPNIVAAYDIVDSGRLHYIVMELVEGVSLKNYIAQKGMLTNRETLGIAVQAAEGLGAAHKNGIIHRDIKPQNIIISRDGRIKITDFGIAVAESDDPAGDQDVIGSVHYIAPEQARTGAADERSDIYSLGISIYEMITGRLPYDAEDTIDILLKHIEDALVPPSVYNRDIYPALNDIIIRATRKDPSERYQSTDELIEDLNRAYTEPEGHFVKFFDAVPSGSGTALSGGSDDYEEKPADEDPAYDTDRGGEGAAGDTEKTVPAIHVPHGKRFILTAMAVFAIFIIIVICLVMIKNYGDRRVSAAAGEETPEAAADDTSTESQEESINYTISIKGEELMPELIGLSADEAARRLGRLNLSLESSFEDYSDEYEKGLIISQNPVSGEIVAAGSTVYVTVSRGSKTEEVLESLRGLALEQAKEALLGVDIEPFGERGEFSEEIPEGCVIGYEREEGTDAGDSQIVLVVSMGSQSGYVLVPDVIGYTADDGIYELYESGLYTDRMIALNGSDYDEYCIVSLSQTPGSYVKPGSSIDLYVSVPEDEGIADGTVIAESVSDGWDITDYDEYDTDEEDTGSDDGLDSMYYYANIDTVCSIGTRVFGPMTEGSGERVTVGIRLMQNVDGSSEYTQLTAPIPVETGEVIPVVFTNIRGVFGVEEGYIEVYNTDSGELYASYLISFAPVS